MDEIKEECISLTNQLISTLPKSCKLPNNISKYNQLSADILIKLYWNICAEALTSSPDYNGNTNEHLQLMISSIEEELLPGVNTGLTVQSLLNLDPASVLTCLRLLINIADCLHQSSSSSSGLRPIEYKKHSARTKSVLYTPRTQYIRNRSAVDLIRSAPVKSRTKHPTCTKPKIGFVPHVSDLALISRQLHTKQAVTTEARKMATKQNADCKKLNVNRIDSMAIDSPYRRLCESIDVRRARAAVKNAVVLARQRQIADRRQIMEKERLARAREIRAESLLQAQLRLERENWMKAAREAERTIVDKYSSAFTKQNQPLSLVQKLNL